MYFSQVLLNAFDMHQKGFDVKIVIEGSATRQISELAEPEKPFGTLYTKVKELGLIDCVCKACAAKTGVLDSAASQWLPICEEMSGHVSIGRYIEEGYEVVVF